jgi:nitrogen fixation/metabolism regulation signal transduction histidine kinase
MTSQLDEARRDNERHRAELEAARAYLESILANFLQACWFLTGASSCVRSTKAR